MTMMGRPRTGNFQPASWHGGSHMPPRNIQQQSFSTPLQMHPHHSQLPHLSINARPQPSLDSDTTGHINRLPHNSTLLTPLPGYSAPSLMQNGGGNVAYNTQSYEIYEDDGGRPGTGHASIASMGHGSGDDFDHPQ